MNRRDAAIFLHGLTGGGAERVMVTIANGLADRGYGIDLVLAENADGPFANLVSSNVRVVELGCHHVRQSVPQLTSYIRREPFDDDVYGGFTFNPTLLRKGFWKEFGGYAKYGSEREINDECWSRGLSTAYLVPGFCFHIGYDAHVDGNAQPGILKRARLALGRWLRQAARPRTNPE